MVSVGTSGLLAVDIYWKGYSISRHQGGPRGIGQKLCENQSSLVFVLGDVARKGAHSPARQLAFQLIGEWHEGGD
ncbi:hypothetical protein HYPP_00621 [Hyphomicrobium sp. ghe19]|nr:hypothetical protein HYPP_00621 [Hyphomicrobium sp. ghe19]